MKKRRRSAEALLPQIQNNRNVSCTVVWPISDAKNAESTVKSGHGLGLAVQRAHRRKLRL